MTRQEDTRLSRRMALRGGAAAGLAAPMTLAAPAVRAQGAQRIAVALTDDAPDIADTAARLAERVATASAGALTLEIGAAQPGTGGLGAVGDGSVGAIIGSAEGWIDTDPGFGLFSGVPFGLDPREFEAWILHGGGQALWDALGAAYGVKPILAGDLGTRAAGWFRDPVGAAGDLSGRSMRTSGLGAVAAEAWGMSVVDAPVDSVAGAADATESYGFAADAAANLAEAYPILYTPAALRPQTALTLAVNTATWDALDPALRMTLETCCMAEADYLTGFSVNREMRALADMAGRGVNPAVLPEAVFVDLASTASEAVGSAVAAGTAIPGLWLDYTNFLAEVSLWTTVGESAFSVARARALGI